MKQLILKLLHKEIKREKEPMNRVMSILVNHR